MKSLLLAFVLLVAGCSHEIHPGQLNEGPLAKHEGKVTGMIELADGVKTSGQGTLFVIARKKTQVGGPPLAVVRIPNPILPIGFTMSQKSVMIPTNVFEGEVRLSAKWSKSGSPMQVSPGDLVSAQDQIVKVGTDGVVLKLNQP